MKVEKVQFFSCFGGGVHIVGYCENKGN